MLCETCTRPVSSIVGHPERASLVMNSDSGVLQRTILYVLDAAFTGYGGYFLIQVTRSGGESAVNYAAALPLVGSSCAFLVAAALLHWTPVRAAQVALMASAFTGLALIATLCLVMGVFAIFVLVVPTYVLAILYPYTLVLVTAMYQRWEGKTNNGQTRTSGPFTWLQSSPDAFAARMILIVVLLWSAAIFILG